MSRGKGRKEATKAKVDESKKRRKRREKSAFWAAERPLKPLNYFPSATQGHATPGTKAK